MTISADSDISLKLDVHRSNRISATGVIAGIAASVLLALVGLGLQKLAFHDNPERIWPAWFGITNTLVPTLQKVVPGFLAGWIAGRRGVVHGLLVAVGWCVIALAYSISRFGEIPAEQLLNVAVFGFGITALMLSVAALAGVAVKQHGFGI